ncbi:hypothetical protein Q5P01_020011 [Channa striata]|uniref:Uncharacterized protein n=1 Tax=Channa striata TaxID=64152 RepID=A0AA88LX01_CHASR|nr:hypothetical protein Q5P01_020011 [Channa striata]
MVRNPTIREVITAMAQLSPEAGRAQDGARRSRQLAAEQLFTGGDQTVEASRDAGPAVLRVGRIRWAQCPAGDTDRIDCVCCGQGIAPSAPDSAFPQARDGGGGRRYTYHNGCVRDCHSLCGHDAFYTEVDLVAHDMVTNTVALLELKTRNNDEKEPSEPRNGTVRKCSYGDALTDELYMYANVLVATTGMPAIIVVDGVGIYRGTTNATNSFIISHRSKATAIGGSHIDTVITGTHEKLWVTILRDEQKNNIKGRDLSHLPISIESIRAAESPAHAVLEQRMDLRLGGNSQVVLEKGSQFNTLKLGSNSTVTVKDHITLSVLLGKDTTGVVVSR